MCLVAIESRIFLFTGSRLASAVQISRTAKSTTPHPIASDHWRCAEISYSLRALLLGLAASNIRPQFTHADTAMANSLIQANSDEELWTSERCFIREQLNDPNVSDVSLARTRVEPGMTTELHRLTVKEWYVISHGVGLMEVGGESPFKIGSGDVVVIPENTSQRVSNTGNEDLVFLCICIPRFTPECYESLE
jgi:mannose-6-phosphate isomerase-like protein (cupin superfamily)